MPNEAREAVRGGPGTVVAVVASGVLACAALGQFLFGFARAHVNEDQAMLWMAGRDFTAGTIHQLTLYGRAYGSSLEALPGGLLRAAGIPAELAFPVATALLWVVPWFLTAVAAAVRGHPLLAVAAAGTPALVALDTLVLSASPLGWGASLMVAGLVLPLVVAWYEVRWVALVAIAVGGLGVALNPGAAIVVVPASLFVVLSHHRDTRFVAMLPLTVIPALAYFVGLQWFLSAHPDYDIHAGWSLRPEPELFTTIPERLADHLSALAMQLAPWWWATLVVVVVALVLAARCGDPRGAVVAASASAIIVVALSAPKATDYWPSIYVSASRFLLFLPHLVWFLAWVASEVGVRSDARPPARPPVWLGVAVVGASLVVGTARFEARALAIGSTADESMIVPASDPDAVAERCDEVAAVAGAERVDLVVFRSDRTAAYQCAASWPSRLTSVHPVYDVRAWVLDDLADRPSSGFLVSDVDRAWCDDAAVTDGSLDCRMVGHRLARLDLTRPEPVLAVWARLGEAVRPFDASR